MHCSISGVIPKDPVVSSKTGHLFERQLIEKYLSTEGKCPVTGEELGADDLLPVVADKAVAPRPLAATSVPGMLGIFQNEWDELMLETHGLKQALDQTRQELSQALYQNDAACRVIARLMSERDQAREALAAALASGGGASSSSSSSSSAAAAAAPAAVEAAADEAMEDEAAEGAALPPAVDAALVSASEGLQEARRTRTAPPDLATAGAIGGWAARASHTPHKSNKPGVLGVAVQPSNPSRLLTCGMDTTAVLFDTAEQQTVVTLSGHGKKVTSAAFHRAAAVDAIFTASADKTAKVWRADGDGGYAVAHTFDCHSKDVTAAVPHPAGDFVVSASADGSWAFHDAAAGTTLLHAQGAAPLPEGTPAKQRGFGAADVHGDGMIFSTGGADGVVRLWDLRSGRHVAQLEGHEAASAVGSVAFSENGYHLASGGADGFVKLWDLRKLKLSKELDMSAGGAVHCVAFDVSASYLAAAGAAEVRVVTAKKLAPVATFADHAKPAMGCAWGPSAAFLATVAMDRTLKIFS